MFDDIKNITSLFGSYASASGVENKIPFIRCSSSHVLECFQLIKKDEDLSGAGLSCDMLLDIVAVDYLNKNREKRFELVYIFYSLKHNKRFILKVAVALDEELPSASQLWKSANWAEREVWDMMGVKFSGHPNLNRLLMFKEFEGHPLRKDYPINKRQAIPSTEEVPS